MQAIAIPMDHGPKNVRNKFIALNGWSETLIVLGVKVNFINALLFLQSTNSTATAKSNGPF